uniref:Uncharacterized protein n=2 Tax=Arabidopsis thaliana TaxID=3702 RepID=Q1PF91_ARATH|nr:hypothetical protein At2g06140 [Arabidopsis thaliana]
MGGPHSSHPYEVARHEDFGYDQGYLQEVISVDVHPNNYTYQTNESYQAAELEDKIIGLIRNFVDDHQEDMRKINSRMTEMRAEFGEKFDNLTIRLENMGEALVEINNTLLNHQEDIQDQNTRMVNVGLTVDTVESLLDWKIEELEKKLTNSNESLDWRSNQSYQEEDGFPKAQALYEEETKKEIRFLVEKGKDLVSYSEKGNPDPIKSLRVSIPLVSLQDKVDQEEGLEKEETASFDEDSMAEHNPREEGSETEREEGYLVSQENQIEELSEEDDELTNISSEEREDEELKDVHSCMTIRLPSGGISANPSFGQLMSIEEAKPRRSLDPIQAGKDLDATRRGQPSRFRTSYPRGAERSYSAQHHLPPVLPLLPTQDHSHMPWKYKTQEERLEILMSQFVDQQALDARTLNSRIDDIKVTLFSKVDALFVNFKKSEGSRMKEAMANEERFKRIEEEQERHLKSAQDNAINTRALLRQISNSDKSYDAKIEAFSDEDANLVSRLGKLEDLFTRNKGGSMT